MSNAPDSQPPYPGQPSGGDSASDASNGSFFTEIFANAGLGAPATKGLQGELGRLLAETATNPNGLEDPQLDPARYELLGLVGRGGMGSVHRVHDHVLDRVVALKYVLTKAKPDQFEAFKAESRRMGGLSHPGIVPVHEMGEDLLKRPFFTMKLVVGAEFSSVIESCRGPKKREDPKGLKARASALGALLKVCDAVAYAHSEAGGKLLHRDLKPSNLMVGDYGEVYVLDWGISVALGSGSTKAVGTPDYMSPEQARGEELSVTADVYSLGAIVYELYAGRKPYEDAPGKRCSAEIIQQVLDGPPVSVTHAAKERVPAEIVSIVEKAMMRDPNERFEKVELLADDLRAFLEVRVVDAHARGPVTKLRKWVARNPLVALTAALSLLALIGVIVGAASTKARALQREIDPLIVLELAQREASLRRLHPDTVPDLEAWLADADELIARSADLIARDIGAGDPKPTDVRASVRRGRLKSAALELGAWQTSKGNTYDEVKARIAKIHDLERASLVDARAAWDALNLDLAASPEYGALQLAPLFGLVPLGADPASGWQEFVHLPSGEVPRRNPETRILEITQEDGIVFVLLPQGRFHMGAQGNKPNEPNYDENPQGNESPVRFVSLEAFFFGKHEITQAQWRRMTEESPSGYTALTLAGCTPLNPVESVSWFRVETAFTAHGLVMPTEAQWEYVARAGSSLRWPAGNERETLIGAANLADKTAAAVGKWTIESATWPEFDDGFAMHGPVNALAPNPWGVYGLYGNVREWCQDRFAHYSTAVQGGDGLCLDKLARKRTTRGASHCDNYYHARCAQRCTFPPSYENSQVGARAVLSLD